MDNEQTWQPLPSWRGAKPYTLNLGAGGRSIPPEFGCVPGVPEVYRDKWAGLGRWAVGQMANCPFKKKSKKIPQVKSSLSEI